MPESYHLYALVSEGYHRPFYIGATCDPRLREKAHRKKFGTHFTLNVLETREDAREIALLETEIINWYLNRGVPLLNKALQSSYKGRGLNARLERYIKRARNPKFKHGNGAHRYPRKQGKPIANPEEKAAKRLANRKMREATREQKLNQEENSVKCREAFTLSVADGSAARIAAEWLAAYT